MATIDVGGGSGGRRALNRELTLVPFIDFLLCVVAFLLVTAVWSQMARLNANAAVPGAPTAKDPEESPPQLHVDMRRGDEFVLEWRRSGTVLSREVVQRKPEERRGVAASSGMRLPYLATRVGESWERNGHHRGTGDPSADLAVLHTPNSAAFEDVVAVMDAIHGVQRPVANGVTGPVFEVIFAAD